MSIYKTRIEQMKELLAKEGIDFYLVPTADFHNSEYVNDYFKVRKFLSGFTGSNGTLVISQKETGLWTVSEVHSVDRIDFAFVYRRKHDQRIYAE